MDKSSFRPIQSQPIATQRLQQKKSNQVNGNSFSFHFQQAIQENNKLVLSKHAKDRLEQRGIHISENRWEQIEGKVQEAKKLGIKDSLVLLDDAALIVSAKNNTVITAMDRQEATSQIFTNINGTIVLE
ncbi:TIGR02530 family flagellar biosynthesis protein [Robertmurraya kyonggiensis]|uniref:Flagellar protein n=1 Tax=Robertmurraya kyonggiensis TaxID=1037680 RepID=A0A4U1D7Z7_9BACI|nr:TIGR02530 family flagellar biosynthesis protein [Robertmurraya kyonggiensis]TKC18662.1 flagellar protein [Robertmurraya kyonggiensis]